MDIWEKRGKGLKNIEILVAISQKNNIPVSRLRVSYGSNKEQGNSWTLDKNHFKYCRTSHSTDICVGTRVVIDDINYLPEIGLYNGAYSTIIDTV